MEKETELTPKEIAEIVAIWDALDTLVKAGVMPDVEMATTYNEPYTDRWFFIGRAEFCITNEDGHKPHLADVVDIWNGNDTDPESTCIADLRKRVS